LVASDGAIFSSDKNRLQVGNTLESLKLGFDVSLGDKVFVGVTIGDHDENLSRLGIDSLRALENFGTILNSLSDIGGFSVVLVVVHSEDVRDKLSLGECVESSDIMRVFHELEDVETSRVDIVADAEFCVE
jgi:hypothetical protein